MVCYTDAMQVSLTILKNHNYYFFQHRDDKPGIASPGLFAGFGGAIEPGETPLQAAKRELAEETSLDVSKLTFEVLGKVDLSDQGLGVRYIYLAEITDANFDVFEGQGKVRFSKDELTNASLGMFAPSTQEAIKLILRDSS